MAYNLEDRFITQHLSDCNMVLHVLQTSFVATRAQTFEKQGSAFQMRFMSIAPRRPLWALIIFLCTVWHATQGGIALLTLVGSDQTHLNLFDLFVITLWVSKVGQICDLVIFTLWINSPNIWIFTESYLVNKICKNDSNFPCFSTLEYYKLP